MALLKQELSLDRIIAAIFASLMLFFSGTSDATPHHSTASEKPSAPDLDKEFPMSLRKLQVIIRGERAKQHEDDLKRQILLQQAQEDEGKLSQEILQSLAPSKK